MTNEEASKVLTDWIEYVNDPESDPYIAPYTSKEILLAMQMGAKALDEEKFRATEQDSELEEEIEDMWAGETKHRGTCNQIAELTKQDYINIAKHFVEWGQQHK
jgi:hypothetical protein